MEERGVEMTEEEMSYLAREAAKRGKAKIWKKEKLR